MATLIASVSGRTVSYGIENYNIPLTQDYYISAGYALFLSDVRQA
jgi:hypothetical protein